MTTQLNRILILSYLSLPRHLNPVGVTTTQIQIQKIQIQKIQIQKIQIQKNQIRKIQKNSDSEDSEESDSEDSEESEDSDRGNTDNDTLVVSIKTVSISSSKHVRFSNDTVTHIIEIEDRKGYWTEDRFRFQQRCASVRDAISFIFDEIHRRKMRLIINRSDTLRGVVMTYNPFVFGHIPTCDPKPTIICSNISRGHTTMFASMLAPVQWKRS